MVVARQIADILAHPLLEGQRGALYLGSTAPDIRVLLRWERERTHFFRLDIFDEQDGTRELLRAYPALARPERLSPLTASFICGYITHLVMDEVWIDRVYRPYFGQRSPMKGSLRAKILDRLLQYELDRQKRADRRSIEHILEELARTSTEVEVEFLGREELNRWWRVTLMAANTPPDWHRFRFMADRYLHDAGIASPEEYAAFLEAVPALLAEALAYVGPARLQTFLEESVERGVETLRGYLRCD